MDSALLKPGYNRHCESAHFGNQAKTQDWNTKLSLIPDSGSLPSVRIMKKTVYDICVEDKKPTAIFYRQGFSHFLCSKHAGYILPDRHTVANVVDIYSTKSSDTLL